MTRGVAARALLDPVGRLRRAPLHRQSVIMLASVAGVSILLMSTLVTAAVRITIAEHVPRSVLDTAVRGVGFVTMFVAACTIIACLGAAAYLRSSISSVLATIGTATARIASGEFSHRIATSRRDDLGRLACDIDDMACQLQVLEQSRHELIAAVSHELRTPLTIIRGHAFTLGRSEQDARRLQSYALIDEECERLARMISQLLDAAALQVREPDMVADTVDLGALVQRASRRFARQASECRVRIRVDLPDVVPVVVRADEDRICQVVDNLLANAVRHAPTGSSVVLRVRRSDASHIAMSVIDHGEGISSCMQERIFTPFVQGDGVRGALGLGLSIARQIVRAHGSDLVVTSHPGRTEFAFVLAAAASCEGGMGCEHACVS